MLKDIQPDDLLKAVRGVEAGDALLSPRVTRRLITQFSICDRRSPPSAVADCLTDREREIVRLVARDLSNQESAGTS